MQQGTGPAYWSRGHRLGDFVLLFFRSRDALPTGTGPPASAVSLGCHVAALQRQIAAVCVHRPRRGTLYGCWMARRAGARMSRVLRQIDDDRALRLRNPNECRSDTVELNEIVPRGGETNRTAVTRDQHDTEAIRPPSSSDDPGSGARVVPSAAGTTVVALKHAMQEIVGVDALTAALTSLPPSLREEFEPVTPMTWIPVEVVHAVVARVAAHTGRDFDQFMDEAVQRAAERTLRTAWRMLLRVTADRALMSRAPILYSKWRNVGRLQTKVLGPGRFEILLTDWPGMSERSIRSLGVTIETVLRLAGRKATKIQSQSTPDGAKYTVAWQTHATAGR